MSAPSFPNTPRIPLATYRVQLNRGFTFADWASAIAIPPPIRRPYPAAPTVTTSSIRPH